MPRLFRGFERKERPPSCIPIRCDGHWSTDGLYTAIPFNDRNGYILDVVNGTKLNRYSTGYTSNIYTVPDGLLTIYGARLTLEKAIVNPPAEDFTFLSSVDKKDNVYEILFGGNDGFSLTMRPGIGMGWYSSGYNQNLAPSSFANNSYFAGRHQYGVVGKKSSTSAIYYYDKAFYNKTLSSLFSLATTTMIGNPGVSNVWSTIGTIINYVLVYHRALTDKEVFSIHDNPWQMYEPELCIFDMAPSGVPVISGQRIGNSIRWSWT